MEIREMRAADREPVLDLLEHAFARRELFERYFDHDAAFSYSDLLVAFEGARPVSCVQVFERRIRLRGESVRLGGIGSVATAESARGKGIASELMRRSAERMRARDMALGLLFSRRFTFYEPLGWQQVSLRLFKLRHPARPLPRNGDVGVRAFRPDDQERVAALYDAYTEPLSGTTLRDARYWAGQLRTAGAPGEDFRVAERDGELVAYVRAATFDGRPNVLEYARSDSGARALARLLVELAPEDRSLPVPLVRDAELGEALRELGAEPEPAENPHAMWLVLDKPALARIAGVSPALPDRPLLESLVGGPEVVYWPSDRF